ncbi:Nitrous-oxide reductase, Sec-dependent (plasmid) [Gemmatirosa kalamazoonensis]|uniref:Nitrous-oxide reductase, Sec-dependent n=1 Tax=Gemmatirosa kalamazoonensis TaxID=861299 RepID=W0RSK3_9BACT|nr:Sec-dependent nitrous-oxide reductase [Gemmatirosa kalamazoonensis]AHG92568.1 Nitrous-oxide reductase, Sec-dependent [Gemmatirosa kalamazoonensis]
MKTSRSLLVGGGAALLGGLLFLACRTTGTPSANLAVGDAASKVYVAPGQHDEYYAFMSGGFSGQVSVYGLPSGRLLKVIPVFSQNAENGWGYNEETKPMLETTYGFIPWDDSHHTELSQTDGVPNGKWLFINGNNTPRIARIDLTTFETDEIVQIPNAAGGHASPFTTPDGRYVVSATRFSIPIGDAGENRDVAIDSYKDTFKGTLSFVKADEPTKMRIAFQILMPGYDYDLGHAGKGPSEGWFFFTSYNSERAYTKLEANASQADKDYIAAVNYKQAESCVAQGKARTVNTRYAHNWMDEGSRAAKSEMVASVPMLDPRTCPGLVYYLPTPKSPHGVDVDPTGEYIVAGGKLATVIPVHSATKLLKAIADKQFESEIDGIPVLKYQAVLAGEVQKPGLGPLHTEFDGRGNAYTSMFISSEVVKWKLGTWEVLDRAPTYYSVGHLMIPGGDTKKPWGKYLVAMNKITKDRYLPTGPELAQSAQLYDISGDKIKLLLDFPTIGEPHYANAVPASLIEQQQVKFYKLTENTHPFVTKAEAQGGIKRAGKRVDVNMVAIRSHFAPDNLEGVQLGDTVYFHVTNIEQDWDILHGFAVLGATNAELILNPGETKTLKWVPAATGVYPFYCTDFCSALHQEMQGYVRVSPAGSTVTLSANTSPRAATQLARLPNGSAAPRAHKHGND